MLRARALCCIALAVAAACSSFDAADPTTDPDDGGATEAGAFDGGEDLGREAGGPVDAHADRDVEAGVDASGVGASCAHLGSVDFCSDFDDEMLPGPWSGRIPDAPGPFVIVGNARALSISVPTDSVPTTGVLYRDVLAAKRVAFGFDIRTTKAWTTGDYVEPFAIDDTTDGGGTFSFKVRFTPDGKFIADANGKQIADLGPQPLASATRITGTIEFGTSATQFRIARDGKEVAANPVSSVPQPASLRVMAGLVYAEAQGGGAILLDTIVVDRVLP